MAARTEHRFDATPFLPQEKSLEALREAAAGCRGCHLYAQATQTVFGEGLKKAKVTMVGEVPGDREDREGHPFVGPAGRELDKALEAVGIDRADVYITNVVKHFKFEERGKRRIHKKPGTTEIVACRPWLEAEVAVIKPEMIVCLGATAARSILGPAHRLTLERGRFVSHPWAPHVTSTVHPSSILRATDDDQRQAHNQERPERDGSARVGFTRAADPQ